MYRSRRLVFGALLASLLTFTASSFGQSEAPVASTTDTEAPAIRWQAGTRQSFEGEGRLAPDSESARRRRARHRYEGKPAKDSWISVAGVLQTPLPWVDFPNNTFLSRAVYPVQIKSDRPQVFLEAPGTIAALGGSDSTLGDRLLWITAEDAGTGVESMTLCLHEEGKDCPPGGAPAAATSLLLRIKATDLAGNESQKEIVLRRGGGQKASR